MNAVASGAYVLTVHAAGFAPQAREIVLRADEPSAYMDTFLRTGGAFVVGMISSDDGTPIAQARVRAYRALPDPRMSFFAITGPDGRFQLSVEAGSHQLEVSHDDYCRAWQNVVAGDKPCVADVALIRARVIGGHVIARNTGTAVDGAMLFALARPDVAVSRAGNDGAFTLRGLAHSTAYVGALAPGYASTTVVEVADGDSVYDVRVIVDPAFAIVGCVVAYGDPALDIADVAIEAWPLDDRVLRPSVAVTDSDGVFRLDGIAPGDYRLSAEKRGWLTEPGIEITVVNCDVTDVTVELRRARALIGRVEPPLVAQIVLGSPRGLFSLHQAETMGIQASRTESDETGAFIIRDAPAIELEVRAMARDGSSGTMTVPPGHADRTDLVITLSPRISVSGRVIDTNGDPRRAFITPLRIDQTSAVRFRNDGLLRGVNAAGDGSFTIVGLDAGRWLLGAQSGKLEVDLSDGADRTDVVITVAPPAANATARTPRALPRSLPIAEVDAMRAMLDHKLALNPCDHQHRRLAQAWLIGRAHDPATVFAWLAELGDCDCHILTSTGQAR